LSWNFVGYRYSLPFMGGTVEKPDDDIRKDLALFGPLVDSQTVFVTHSPAFGVLDLGMLGLHAGSRTIFDFVAVHKPLVHTCGHVHEQFGRPTTRLGDRLGNPGAPSDEVGISPPNKRLDLPPSVLSPPGRRVPRIYSGGDAGESRAKPTCRLALVSGGNRVRHGPSRRSRGLRRQRAPQE
jgi:hypothetical protein